MTTTTKPRAIEWEADPSVPPRTIRSGSEADTLLRWDEVGRPLSKALKSAVDAFVFLNTSARPQASRRLSVAEAELAAYSKEDARGVADAVLVAAQRGQAIQLPGDRLADLEAEVREAERLYQGTMVAAKAAYRLMVEEVKAAGVEGLKLEEVWTELVSFEPTDSIRENRAFETYSAEVFGLVEALTILLEGGRDVAREERKRLSEMFARRPVKLPRLAHVRAEMRGERENTPRAQQIKAAETAAKARKVEDRLYAQRAARARRGGDGSQNTEKPAAPVAAAAS